MDTAIGQPIETAQAGDELHADAGQTAEWLEQLGGALGLLAEVEPELAQLVDLHFFCGVSLVELAELRGISERTAERPLLAQPS